MIHLYIYNQEPNQIMQNPQFESSLMENYSNKLVIVVTVLVFSMVNPATSQIPGIPMAGCTTAMITSFAPCVGYLTGGGGSGSPTADCCQAFGKLVSSGSDCACFMLNGGVPFSLPINRSMAVSLPSFCRSSSFPLFQCNSNSSTGFNPFGGSSPPLFPTSPPSPVQVLTPPPAGTPAPSSNPGSDGLKPLLFPSAGGLSFKDTSSAATLPLLVVLAAHTILMLIGV